MKAIYDGELYHVVEVGWANVILLGADKPIAVKYEDPRLIIDPTDREVEEANGQGRESR